MPYDSKLPPNQAFAELLGKEQWKITVHTDYALRLLMYLALKKDGLTTIAEIAVDLRHLKSSDEGGL